MLQVALHAWGKDPQRPAVAVAAMRWWIVTCSPNESSGNVANRSNSRSRCCGARSNLKPGVIRSRSTSRARVNTTCIVAPHCSPAGGLLVVAVQSGAIPTGRGLDEQLVQPARPGRHRNRRQWRDRIGHGSRSCQCRGKRRRRGAQCGKVGCGGSRAAGTRRRSHCRQRGRSRREIHRRNGR